VQSLQCGLELLGPWSSYAGAQRACRHQLPVSTACTTTRGLHTYNGSNHEPGFLSYRRLPAYSLSLQLAIFSYLISCRIIPSNCRCVLGISLRNCTMAVHECVLSCPSRPIGLAQMSRHQLQCPHGTGSLEMMPVTACSLLRHHKDPTSVYKKFPCCLLPSTCTAAQSLVQSTYNFDTQPCRRNLSCDLFLP
jgi:hypothetical protein